MYYEVLHACKLHFENWGKGCITHHYNTPSTGGGSDYLFCTSSSLSNVWWPSMPIELLEAALPPLLLPRQRRITLRWWSPANKPHKSTTIFNLDRIQTHIHTHTIPFSSSSSLSFMIIHFHQQLHGKLAS